MNSSKANDSRFWHRWALSGAVGTYHSSVQQGSENSMTLNQLLDQRLKNRSIDEVGVEALWQATKRTASHYHSLAQGLFVPDVGVIGDWSVEEKCAVKEIINARE